MHLFAFFYQSIIFSFHLFTILPNFFSLSFKILFLFYLFLYLPTYYIYCAFEQLPCYETKVNQEVEFICNKYILPIMQFYVSYKKVFCTFDSYYLFDLNLNNFSHFDLNKYLPDHIISNKCFEGLRIIRHLPCYISTYLLTRVNSQIHSTNCS